MFEWMGRFLQTLDDRNFCDLVARCQRNDLVQFNAALLGGQEIDLPRLPKYLMDECTRRIALYREREGLTG